MHCNIKKINPAAYMKDEKIANMDEKRMNVRFYSNLKFKLNDDDIYSPDNEKEKNKSEKQIMTPMRLILNYRDGRLFLRFFVTKNNISILER